MVPKVSIIISVLDQLAYTKHCLASLKDTLSGKIDYEVLIVDDGSSDETVQFLRSLESPHTVLFNSEKKGFSKNNNHAVKKAKAEFLCLLNNDVFVQGNWLIPMLEVFEQEENVGVVGNVQRLAGTKLYDHMGVVFGPKGNPRHYGQWFKKRVFTNEVRKWSAVTAACCVVKRNDFLKLGGFDEIFLNGCEDVDLCLRYNRNGFKNFVVHDSVVDHVKGATDGRKRYNDRNSEILQKRWGQEIRAIESVNDQVLHAYNYIFRGIVRPFSTNLWKWLEAILIYLRIRRLK